VQVTIEGVQPQHARPVPLTTEIQNGGFEDGMWAWSGVLADRVRVAPQGRTGQSALLLDAAGVTDETQAYSAPMLVQQGAMYELDSYVECLQGTGGYKVTIDWLGDAGHIAYDNDWKGEVPPADWTQHGGQFRAPEGARRAVLILGCRAGTRYLFDDVSLRKVGGG
jgi:hypothetical protein